jgi:branched-chain amino acid transport system permease protein
LPVALFFAMLMAGLMAVTAERLSYKPVRVRGGDPRFFMIASLGVGILIENTIRLVIGSQYRAYPNIIPSRTVEVLGVNIAIYDIVAASIAAIGLVLLEFYISKTKAGTAIRAAACDMRTAGLMGINVDKLILRTFFISGMLAGLAGMFLGVKYNVYPTLGNIQTKAMIGAIFGGLGSIPGAVYGALILGVLEVLVAGYISSTVRDIVVFCILIVLLLVKPNGLKGRSLEEKV